MELLTLPVSTQFLILDFLFLNFLFSCSSLMRFFVVQIFFIFEDSGFLCHLDVLITDPFIKSTG